MPAPASAGFNRNYFFLVFKFQTTLVGSAPMGSHLKIELKTLEFFLAPA
jgi:hypothetical protein